MKKIILIISLAFAALSSKAQIFSTIFADMPKDVVPLLSRNNRLDMVDFFNSKMLAEVDNTMKGKSTLLELTDNYIKVKLNDKALLEMMLLPRTGSNDTIVCIVNTISAQASESEVDFYDLKWSKISREKVLRFPDNDAFWKKMDKNKLEKAKKELGNTYIEAHLDGKDKTLRFGLSMATLENNQTEADNKDSISSCVFKTVVYKWTGKRFVFSSKED